MKKIIIVVVILLIALIGLFIFVPKDKLSFEGIGNYVKELNYSRLPEKCKEQVIDSGNCMAMGLGYQYNKEKGVCEEAYTNGCETISPFKTLEECKNICE